MKERVGFIVGLFGSSLLQPALAFASDPHGPDYSTLIWPGSNFVLLVILFTWLYRKFGRSALEKRQQNISEHLVKASAEVSAAEDTLQQSADRKRRLEDEQAGLVETYQKEAERMSDTVLTSAKDLVPKIERDAELQIERDLEQATKEIRRDVVLLATEKARVELGAAHSDEKDRELRQRVLGDFISSV